MVKDKLFDVVILGSGPAGLTAALYTARAKRSTLVIAGSYYAGQLMLTYDVENYPGFPEGVLGPKLMEAMIDQAKKFGAEFFGENATRVNFKVRPFKITAGGKE
ncbi:hypothetical protein A2Z23_02735 [Candidatus Curtissbacteria bacterium RBG_16_39_7]|uniref:FAD/NAD(P)-binding domain-containing protein n=1 Tax=Candidatus Curtissbacteria bacterium RBG_16_39_7 TaxID=1797707 RepID=A0A1F5G1N0_9BACT|nr:MAG: hypothetical protein A2Z23_02735 [Candidatus Curtissbacteria bacterium RBG_16_39_7]